MCLGTMQGRLQPDLTVQEMSNASGGEWAGEFAFALN